MKLLVFGQTGQVATELRRRAPTTMIALGRDQADLRDPASCGAAILAHAPDAVINAAAFTAVDRAEAEEPLAHLINAETPGAMARVCAGLDIPFLHVSTDYVFDGSGDVPWQPSDTPAPLNAYGRTKLGGEQAVQAAGGRHAILRTSWVFSAHGSNFVKTMLHLGRTRAALRVVNDQIGGPTPAAAIAEALIIMAAALKTGQTGGTYHYAGTPATSWQGFARETFARAGMAVDITGVATADYPTAARRPLNSRLDCASLRANFGITPPDWRTALADVIKELGT